LSAVARRYYVRALEALRRGETESARDDLRGALELAPGFVAARIAWASVLAATGDSPGAAALLRDALAAERRPRARAALLRALGEVLISVGDYRGAEQALTDAGAPADAWLHDRLARLRAKTGRFPEALDELLAAARASR
jgi:thioredoxin-like negative regulator of GroEL